MGWWLEARSESHFIDSSVRSLRSLSRNNTVKLLRSFGRNDSLRHQYLIVIPTE